MVKQLWRFFYYCILLGFGLVALFLVSSTLPINRGFQSYIVLSGSMEPDVPVGSLVLVKAKPDYYLGDIVTYKDNSQMVTHRIVGLDVAGDQETYVTKGDSNEDPDLKPVNKTQVKGELIFVLPYLGYAIDFAKKPIGFIALIVIPGTVIIYDELKKIIKEFKSFFSGHPSIDKDTKIKQLENEIENLRQYLKKS